MRGHKPACITNSQVFDRFLALLKVVDLKVRETVVNIADEGVVAADAELVHEPWNEIGCPADDECLR